MRALLRFLLLLLLMAAGVSAKSFIESCNSAARCTSLVGYRVAAQTQRLQDIATLFNLDIISLLASNNFDITAAADPLKLYVSEQQIVKVPITCSCVDGIWRGSSTVYIVKPGDTLSTIADELFSGLVTSKQISQANGNPSKVDIGTRLAIPFPCACSSSSNLNEMMFSYVVKHGDSVAGISTEYGTGFQEFMALNSMNNASQLIAGDVVEVPLHACSSNLRRSAADFGLVVANGTYAVTAGRCVQCTCLPNLEQVHCAAVPAAISGACPDMKCVGTNITIGQMTSVVTMEGCSVTSCLYNGYKKRIILSSLQTVSLSTCPAPPPPPTYRGVATPGTGPALAPSTARNQPGTIPSTQLQQPGRTAAPAPSPSSSRREVVPGAVAIVALVLAALV